MSQIPTPAVSGTQAAPVPLGDSSPSSAPTVAVTPSPTPATKPEKPPPAATETERRPSDEAKPRTTERKAAKPDVAKAAGDWLPRQPKRNYVVQLYATYQRASAQQFIASHSLAAKANIIATVRDGKTWYVVVYGSYRDRTKAKAAISGLPVALRELKPWVRQVGDLQAVAAP
jgi:DamX protein